MCDHPIVNRLLCTIFWPKKKARNRLSPRGYPVLGLAQSPVISGRPRQQTDVHLCPTTVLAVLASTNNTASAFETWNYVFNLSRLLRISLVCWSALSAIGATKDRHAATHLTIFRSLSNVYSRHVLFSWVIEPDSNLRAKSSSSFVKVFCALRVDVRPQLCIRVFLPSV